MQNRTILIFVISINFGMPIINFNSSPQRTASMEYMPLSQQFSSSEEEVLSDESGQHTTSFPMSPKLKASILKIAKGAKKFAGKIKDKVKSSKKEVIVNQEMTSETQPLARLQTHVLPAAPLPRRRRPKFWHSRSSSNSPLKANSDPSFKRASSILSMSEIRRNADNSLLSSLSTPNNISLGGLNMSSDGFIQTITSILKDPDPSFTQREEILPLLECKTESEEKNIDQENSAFLKKSIHQEAKHASSPPSVIQTLTDSDKSMAHNPTNSEPAQRRTSTSSAISVSQQSSDKNILTKKDSNRSIESLLILKDSSHESSSSDSMESIEQMIFVIPPANKDTATNKAFKEPAPQSEPIPIQTAELKLPAEKLTAPVKITELLKEQKERSAPPSPKLMPKPINLNLSSIETNMPLALKKSDLKPPMHDTRIPKQIINFGVETNNTIAVKAIPEHLNKTNDYSIIIYLSLFIVLSIIAILYLVIIRNKLDIPKYPEKHQLRIALQ